MMNLHESEHCHDGFLGVWEDIWRERAMRAHQAERYRQWLRTQGCSRDEAAELAVRFLAAHPPTGPHRLTPPETPIIHRGAPPTTT